ncbi:cytochrome P450 [Gymnopilus junonius]|uniref:Cytochrome P450 n=1 Tax=Gymnopilus junonius TaxID=109634 RepID=A0A9P5TKA6_GYMJU|nr:cytochrome P450 [Gymnopilus junonius]
MAEVAISHTGFYGLMLLRRVPILNQLPLAVIQSQGNVRKTIHAGVAQELLNRNRALLEVSDAQLPDDLLFELLMAQRDGRISRDELLDHVRSETTAQGLSYAIWELAKNPEVQDRLRREVAGLSSPVDFDELQNSMPYLDATEAASATPYMERNTMEDDVIPLAYPITDSKGRVHSEINIRAGQTVIIPIHSVNRLSTTWGDGDRFRPERWLSKEGLPPKEMTPGGWSGILTFSDGPRICTGYRLAIFEFKLFLATLVGGHGFEDSGVGISDRYASTMNPVVVGEEERGPQLPVRVVDCLA